MALEGCYACIKYLMFAFNFLFWLLGCVILGIGIWVKVDPNSILKITDDQEVIQNFLSDSKYYGYESTSAYVLITVGSIIMVIGFLGCCGAIRESQCMLALFFVFLLLIFVVLLAIGVYIIITKNKLKEELCTNLGRKIKIVIGEEQVSQKEKEDAQKLIRVVQDKFNCCGNERGVADYGKWSANATVHHCQFSHLTDPCCPVFYQKLTQNFVIIGGVAIGIALVLFLGMVFSMLLCCAIRENMA